MSDRGHCDNENGNVPPSFEPGQRVGIAPGYGLDNRGVGIRVPVGPIILSSPRQSDRPWGPSSLLSNV
jgi:hypothetical protein